MQQRPIERQPKYLNSYHNKTVRQQKLTEDNVTWTREMDGRLFYEFNRDPYEF